MNWIKGLIGLCAVLAVIPTPSFGQRSKDDTACSESALRVRYPAHGVGTATMMENGTICVEYKPFIDPEGDSGKPEPMLVVYARSRPGYSAALREIGALKPGETKVIRRYLKH